MSISSLPLLAFFRTCFSTALAVRHSSCSSRSILLGQFFSGFLDNHTHVTSVPSLPTIAFVLTNAAFNSNAGIFTSLAGALPVTSFLAFSAPLASRLGRQIFFVSGELMLEVEHRAGSSSHGAAGWGSRGLHQDRIRRRLGCFRQRIWPTLRSGS